MNVNKPDTSKPRPTYLSPVRESFLAPEQGVEAMNRILARMIGEQCFSCIATECTGSTLLLAFGDRVPWPSKSTNRDQSCHGTYGLIVVGAAWRILHGRRAIMTSDAAMTEENAAELRIVTNLAMTSGSICQSTLDLQITFESDVKLDIFCNCFDESLDNYTLSYLHNYYTVRYAARTQIIELEEGIQT